MRLLKTVRAAGQPPAPAPPSPRQTTELRVPTWLEPRDWETESLNGQRLCGRGYMLRDADGVGFTFDDCDLEDLGCLVCSVAGVSFRPESLARPDFVPGQRLQLLREPNNPYDQNAVGVWNVAASAQLGYVPRDIAATLASRCDADEVLEAFSLWEWQLESTGGRCALRVFVGPESVTSKLLATIRQPA